jgi:hypothetical protein
MVEIQAALPGEQAWAAQHVALPVMDALASCAPPWWRANSDLCTRLAE